MRGGDAGRGGGGRGGGGGGEAPVGLRVEAGGAGGGGEVGGVGRGQETWRRRAAVLRRERQLGVQQHRV